MTENLTEYFPDIYLCLLVLTQTSIIKLDKRKMIKIVKLNRLYLLQLSSPIQFAFQEISCVCLPHPVIMPSLLNMKKRFLIILLCV